ncbi:hypothetical protein L202_03760 [Cryptococcus amylolentus CBS 6039]|uniref:RRM domain-containing protein n=1 Tax=Cryptococcus amylolentus CBS 6039 TaxID=1295533 RepID=A0A1E3HU43_9TREE|nr:hypothetical protein L202_03760 [Cryptococcus amylolentus CBS 6039]ODN79867.1 hypothetical protein L202_03760 [Cryptococcus amylolentus CBS 6039]
MNKNAESTNASSVANRKSSVYVSGIAPAVNEEQLLQAFVTFGDIIEIKIPHEPHDPKKHRGYAFITFSSAADAQEAIDNYDLNQLPGYQGSDKFLKCSLAQPSKYVDESGRGDRPIWETEEWRAEHGQPKEDGEENAGES